MTDRLTEIRARLDAATPGPWYADTNTKRLWVCQRTTGRPMAEVVDGEQVRDLIAHAPSDIAWLLAEVERVWDYAYHRPSCAVVESPHNKCDCGLNALVSGGRP